MSAELPDFEPVFIRFRGRVQGPYGLDQLQALHKRGQFSRAHEISADRNTWRSAATLEILFPRTTKKSSSMAKTTELDLAAIVEATANSPVSSKTVKPVWHYSIGKESYGPVTVLELRSLLAGGQLMAGDLVWKEGLDDWTPASRISELSRAADPQPSGTTRGAVGATNYCAACGNMMDRRAEVCPQCGVRQLNQVFPKNRMVTALLAIFLGSFGLHRFYLGHAIAGLAYNIFWMFFAAALYEANRGGELQLQRICALGVALPGVFAFVEGVVFLCMSDAAFARKYNQQQE